MEIDAHRQVTAVLTLPLDYRPRQSPALILAHSAGSDKDDPLFRFLHLFLAARGFLTVRFDFPYRIAGRRLPDREDVLEATFRRVLAHVVEHPTLAPGAVFLGGKSLGGRMATHLAAKGTRVRGLVLLAYPLQPPGRPDRRRDEHLPRLGAPALFLSGTRDALAPRPLLESTISRLPDATLHWLEQGDHSFRVPRSSGLADEDVHRRVSEIVADWMDHVLSRPQPPPGSL